MTSLQIRAATAADEDFLWRMLYYAAHMEQDGATSPYAARDDAYLARYVRGWGAASDLGVIGMLGERLVGAVWSRVLEPAQGAAPEAAEALPEIAAAVDPAFLGQGIGTRLLRAYLDMAGRHIPAVTLSVRADNPAARLYERLGFQVCDVIVNRVGTQSLAMIYRFDAAAGFYSGEQIR
jgi:ribosomal protein S18 acetylase RimI-like enzyme